MSSVGERWCPADPIGYTPHRWIDHEAAGPGWEICRNCHTERNPHAGEGFRRASNGFDSTEIARRLKGHRATTMGASLPMLRDLVETVISLATEPKPLDLELAAPLSDRHPVHSEGPCDVDLSAPGSEGF